MSSSWSEPRGSRLTAEESYAQSLAHAGVLWTAACRLASEEDAVGALTLAWGADVSIVQAILWQHILGASAATRRHLYRAALTLILPQGQPMPAASSPRTCGEALERARARMLSECDPGLASAIGASWEPLSDLGSLAAPTAEDVERSVSRRLEGRAPRFFIAARREAAQESMVLARELRVRGEGAEAVEAAYASDGHALEAYLVESALAAGDHALMSVTIRWVLAMDALARMGGVPEGFEASVVRIREVMFSALPEADADRLRLTLVPAY